MQVISLTDFCNNRQMNMDKVLQGNDLFVQRYGAIYRISLFSVDAPPLPRKYNNAVKYQNRRTKPPKPYTSVLPTNLRTEGFSSGKRA